MEPAAEYLNELAVAIRINHLCEPTHRASIFVSEKNCAEEKVWEGFVEVFDLSGHPESDTCYAWLDRKNPNTRIMTVLGNVLVDSPKRAVQAAIFMDMQPAASEFSQSRTLLRWQIAEARTILNRTRMKTEDLTAAMDALKQTQDRIGTLGNGRVATTGRDLVVED